MYMSNFLENKFYLDCENDLLLSNIYLMKLINHTAIQLPILRFNVAKIIKLTVRNRLMWLWILLPAEINSCDSSGCDHLLFIVDHSHWTFMHVLQFDDLHPDLD